MVLLAPNDNQPLPSHRHCSSTVSFSKKRARSGEDISDCSNEEKREKGMPRNRSWPYFRSFRTAQPIDGSSAFEDKARTWNLDIETGKIEREIAQGPFNVGNILEQGDFENEHEGTRQLHQWFHRVDQAGGDFPRRLKDALRASMGSLLFFSALVFTNPTHLGAVWIGNIFMLSSIKGNLGESYQVGKAFAKSIVLTTIGSAPIAYLLSQFPTNINQIVLPPLTFCLSFLIMICPWMDSPNLMILVMYVVVAAPVRFEVEWWDPIGYVGSYLIGLAVALFMNCLPPPTPNTATRQVHDILQRTSRDFSLLFVQIRNYTFTAGHNRKLARAAGAAIEVLVNRVAGSTAELRRLLPHVSIEQGWLSKHHEVRQLTEWVLFLESISANLKMLKCTLNSRFLGEQGDTATMSTRHMRQVIASELGQVYHDLIDAMIHLIVVCNQAADPLIKLEKSKKDSPYVMELSNLVVKTRSAFGKAVLRLTEEAQKESKNQDPLNETPLFAHLARRSTSVHSLLSIATALVTHIDRQNAQKKSKHRETNLDVPGRLWQGHRELFTRLVGEFVSYIHESVWKPKWHWSKSDKRRLALKTALGMMLASLWMAVPQLWTISQPFGFWPGLTVASVNLLTMGSSFHKAIDRLVGTLFAAAYALLVADFFPGNQDAAKVPAIMVFTFAVIYLKKDEHAYQYSYAATSIGSMLYGSVKNDYDVKAYIPQRIQLIFVGVVTFALIELIAFPKSSRLSVEAKTLEYFDLMGAFLKKARDFARSMQSSKQTEGEGSHTTEEALVSVRILEELASTEKLLKNTSATLKKELRSALLEPYFGFSHRLHAQALNGLVSEIAETGTQSFLLVSALEMVSVYNEVDEGSTSYIFQAGWPDKYAEFLDKAAEQMDETCRDLHDAYPDGRFRPQHGNTLRAIAAAASFRDFHDVRYTIVAEWSALYHKTSPFRDIDPNELILLGVTTSFILELCRHLQLTGRKMEWATEQFPAYI